MNSHCLAFKITIAMFTQFTIFFGGITLELETIFRDTGDVSPILNSGGRFLSGYLLAVIKKKTDKRPAADWNVPRTLSKGNEGNMLYRLFQFSIYDLKYLRQDLHLLSITLTLVVVVCLYITYYSTHYTLMVIHSLSDTRNIF